MNAKAERPEWLSIIEQCEAQGGVITDLPSLGDKLGSGSWRIYPGNERADGQTLHILYWSVRGLGTRKEVRVGSFYRIGKRQARQRTNSQTDMLTVGWDDCGRRIMHCPSRGDELLCIHMDAVGPIPVPVRSA